MFELQNRGTRCVVTLPNGKSLDGWYYGHTPFGILVAVDDDASDIRVVPEYQSVSLQHVERNPGLAESDAEEISNRLVETNRRIAEPLRGAVSGLSFSELHAHGHRLSELREGVRLRQFDDGFLQAGDDELAGFLLANADRATDLHGRVFNVLRSSGVADVLEEFGPRLAALPPDYTLPLHDLEFASRSDLTATLLSTRESGWSAVQHSARLRAAEEVRSQLLLQRDRPTPPPPKEPDERKADNSTRLSRWIGPSLRILAGTGLTIANAGLALSAGLTATLATIGATAVPTYVGVATSMYTGVTQVADGLEKIGRRK